MTEVNSDLTSSLVQILRRADRLAAYGESGNTLAASPAAELRAEPPGRPVGIADLMAGARKSGDGDKKISRWLSGARMAIFGLALVLVATFVMQIGLAGQDAIHRWVFFAASGLLAVVGVVQIDRGTRQLAP